MSPIESAVLMNGYFLLKSLNFSEASAFMGAM